MHAARDRLRAIRAWVRRHQFVTAVSVMGLALTTFCLAVLPGDVVTTHLARELEVRGVGATVTDVVGHTSTYRGSTSLDRVDVVVGDEVRVLRGIDESVTDGLPTHGSAPMPARSRYGAPLDVLWLPETPESVMARVDLADWDNGEVAQTSLVLAALGLVPVIASAVVLAARGNIRRRAAGKVTSGGQVGR
ncbi:hypothetical protein [Cellulomonas rhizosphaerae]|uniref:Uncharacterized protein n=1 Tax=Cellulomonas rhizosphaerae TaxID=2293719 RepID=A0A413RNP0_9CELL|nr:hypothetical protein [Cellulomonas rhizosphaerae]RHA43520.1 hypothetical protein D1825_06010 [Cellulomonas rhizosphaerae]